MSGELSHQSCPLCRRSSGPSSAAPMTKLCEQCRTLVGSAFGGTMSAPRQDVQSAAVLNVPYSASLEYVFEPKSDPVPEGESFHFESESALEIEPGEQATFDEAAIPGWDYSGGEWPVLLSQRKGNPLAQFKTAFVIIAILAIAAAFYFFLLPALQGQRPKPAAQERAPVIAQPAVPQADGQSANASKTPPDSQSTPTEPVNVDGKFALQAAAFSTQSEAEALADNLKEAGVPSYVVSANLARRGKWFRVRVGRFNTAEDAQKFAGQAQLRARSAGMSLQLMVVPYEQP
jgi:cell division protein FtsN